MIKKIILFVMLLVCFTFVFGACKKSSGGSGGSSDPTNITNPPVTYNPRYKVTFAYGSPMPPNPYVDLLTGTTYNNLTMYVVDTDVWADAVGTYDYSNFVWTVSGSGITVSPSKGNNVTVTVEAGASGTITVTNADAVPYTFNIVNDRYQVKLAAAGPMPSNQYVEKSDLATSTTYDLTMCILDLNAWVVVTDVYDSNNFVWTVNGSGITVSPANGDHVTVTVAAGASGTVTVTNANAKPYIFTVR